MLSLRDGRSAPLGGVQSASVPPAADFSPDGRWVAYQSGEPKMTGGVRVLVQSVTTAGPPLPVPNARYPRWLRDGKQLFYQTPGRLFVVTVNLEPSFSVSNASPPLNLQEHGMRITPHTASAPAAPFVRSPRNYDLVDGFRIIGPADETPLATAAARRIEVVLNWHEERGASRRRSDDVSRAQCSARPYDVRSLLGSDHRRRVC